MIRRSLARRTAVFGDEGQIIPLVLVYFMIALGLIIVVIDVTAVHLQRNRLYSLTDSVALDAADALDRPTFYTSGLRGRGAAVAVPLTDGSVRDSVDDFLPRAASGTGLTDVRVASPTGAPDGRTAEVTLAARAQLPVFSVVVRRWWGGVPLNVTARARSQTAP